MAAPVITSISPTSGPPGTKVTVTGTGLSQVTGVTLGGTVVQFTPVSDTSLTFTVPAGMASGVDDLDLDYPGTVVDPHAFTVAGGGGGGPIDTVIWITIENAALADFTPALAPYFNGLLAAWASCTNYTPGANGTGNSLPNYMNATVGAPIWGGDCDACQSADTSIVDLLEKAGKTWQVQAEGLGTQNLLTPFPGSKGGYDNHHNPLAHLSLVNSPGNPRLKNFHDASSLNLSALPNFTHYEPNVLNSGHTPGGSQGIKNIDAFLKGFIPKVLASPKFAPGGSGLAIIWLDNDGKDTSGAFKPVPFVALGPGAKSGGFKSSVAYTPYDWLHTLEAIFGLGSLGRGDASGKLMSDIIPGA